MIMRKPINERYKLPRFYGTRQAAEFLGIPKSRLHDRQAIGLVTPQIVNERAAVYTQRQLKTYRDSHFKVWPDPLLPETALSTRNAALELSRKWGEPISDEQLRRWLRSGVRLGQKIGLIIVISQAELFRFALRYRKSLIGDH